MVRIFILFLFYCAMTPSFAQAQELSGTSSGAASNYVPPPMFGQHRLPPPKAERPHKDTGLPKYSTPITTEQDSPDSFNPKSIKPKILPPTPPDKPSIKLITPKPDENEPTPQHPITQQGKEPIDLLKEKETSPVQSFRATEDVVKSPYTMPANKKQPVESEVLFTPQEDKKSAVFPLMKRLQPKNIAETNKKNLPPPSSDKKTYPLPDFILSKDGTQKFSIVFDENQTSLNEEQKYILAELLLPYLTRNQTVNIRLIGHSSLTDAGIISAKRISLVRTMAIRNQLLQNNIMSNKIYPFAEGSNSSAQPLERVDIVLIP